MYLSKEKRFKDVMSRNFIFCDIGARFGLEERWKSYRNLIDVISFEPDQEEFTVLNNNKHKQDIVLNYALSDEKKELTLNLTKSKGCSSLYEPNQLFVNRFPDENRFTVEKREAVNLITLDYLYKLKKSRILIS